MDMKQDRLSEEVYLIVKTTRGQAAEIRRLLHSSICAGYRGYDQMVSTTGKPSPYTKVDTTELLEALDSYIEAERKGFQGIS